MTTAGLPFATPIGVALLEGLAAGTGAVTLAVFLLSTTLFAFFMQGGFHPFALAPAVFAAMVAASVAGPIMALNLPLALLFARRFSGSLLAALAVGAASGAVEGYLLAVSLGRRSLTADLFMAALGGVGGATFASRVWLSCVAPRRSARARPAP